MRSPWCARSCVCVCACDGGGLRTQRRRIPKHRAQDCHGPSPPPPSPRSARSRLAYYVWSCGRGTPHVWLRSIRPRSQCMGGMLLIQWCYKHVLNCLKVSSNGSAAEPLTLGEPLVSLW